MVRSPVGAMPLAALRPGAATAQGRDLSTHRAYDRATDRLRRRLPPHGSGLDRLSAA